MKCEVSDNCDFRAGFDCCELAGRVHEMQGRMNILVRCSNVLLHVRFILTAEGELACQQFQVVCVVGRQGGTDRLVVEVFKGAWLRGCAAVGTYSRRNRQLQVSVAK